MTNTDDLHALQQAAVSVLDMREGLGQRRDRAAGPATDAGDRIATTEARLEGFYWVGTGPKPAGDRLLGARRVVAGR